MVAPKSANKKPSALRTKCPKEKEDLAHILSQCTDDTKDLCETLQAALDFQNQIDILQKWTCPDTGVYFQSLASLFFHLPLKSSLRRSISYKIRDSSTDKDLMTSCFLHEIKCYEGNALVRNVIKCFDDNNNFLKELVRHLPIQSFIHSISDSLKANNESHLSDALRALSYARANASKSLLDGHSSLGTLLHRIIQCSTLSNDTRGKAAKFLIAEEVLRKPGTSILLDILLYLEDASSPYSTSMIECKLIYLNGIATSTSCLSVIQRVLREYLSICCQRDLDSSSLVTLSRGILRCTNVFVSNDEKNLEEDDIIGIKEYIWNFLEYPMPSVKYNVKDALKDYIKIRKAKKNLDDFVLEVISWNDQDKKKYTVLIPLIKIGGYDVICLVLKNVPRFHDHLIENLSDPALRSLSTELYKVCLDDLQSHEYWNWLRPVIDGYKIDSGNICRRNHLDIIVKEVIKKCDPSIVDTLIKNMLHGESRDPSSTCIVLQCLKTIKLLKGSQFKFDNHIFISECLTDFSDEVRLEAFDFICTSLKTSEVFTLNELDLILELGIKANMLLPNPPLQMQFLSIMKKFISRLNEGYGACKRKNVELVCTNYRNVIEEMLKWIILHNLSRPKVHLYFRSLGFEIVLMCSEIIHDKPDLFLLTPDHGSILIECLKTETHDKNCEIILEILRNSFKSRPDIVNFSLNSIIELVRTPMPRNGSIAQYLTNVLRICELDSTFEKALLEEFHQQVEVAKHSLIRASFEAPLYGILSCLKGGPLLESIVDQCHELWTLVSPIVNDSSPEGFSQKDDDQMECNPQLLLLLAWRTTKEICDVFQTVASRDSSEADILKISMFFIQVFSETKHRGVFERAYSGFCTVASILWTHENPKIRQFPQKLLEDTLHAISIVGDDITVTRRSAGYPFLIQALISSQPGMCSFDCVIEKLLDWALSTVSNISLKIHACNILRAIYKDSCLGDKVIKYISQGMKAAILGFKSNLWPIRNASTLLFSSLITRLFGVKRDQDDLSEKNGVYTFKLFFERFPDLYDFLLEQLEPSEENCQTLNCTTVFPTLLILAKLKMMNSSLSAKIASQIQDFHDRIINFLSNPVLKIRHLAAYALCALSSEESGPNLANTLVKRLTSCQGFSNALHGIFFALNLMVRKNHKVLQVIVPHIQGILEKLSIQSPIILIEKSKLLRSTSYMQKNTLKQELSRIKNTEFPHPGKDLYERLLVEISLEQALNTKDADFAHFLLKHNSLYYFEILNTTHERFDTFVLCLDEGSTIKRINSCTDRNELLCFLKIYVWSNELDNVSIQIWNRILFFTESTRSIYQKNESFLCFCIDAMTKYANSFSKADDELFTWASFLRSCVLNEDNVYIKKTIASSILKSIRHLKSLDDSNSAPVAFLLWSAILTLSLSEEDNSIQKTIYSILVELWGQSKQIIPSQVHVELSDWLMNNSVVYVSETRHVLIQAFEEIRDMDQYEKTDDELFSLAFEKGNDQIRFDDIDRILERLQKYYCDRNLSHEEFNLARLKCVFAI